MSGPPDSMTAALGPGEHGLQQVDGWLLPTVTALKHVPGVGSLAVAFGVFASVMCGCVGAAFTPLGGGLALGLGLLSSALAGGLVVARTARRVGTWVVTTQRVVYTSAGKVTQVPVANIVDVDIDPRTDTLTLTTATGTHAFTPVAGLQHLWGAALFARAWQPGLLEVAGAVTVHPMLAWMAMERTADVHVRGVLILRPDSLAWIPERLTRQAPGPEEVGAYLAARAVGLRLDRVHALPPVARLVEILQSLRDPADFDREIVRITQRWGGWTLPAAEVAWELSSGMLGVAVEFTLDGKRYTANGVSRSPDWPAIEAAWKQGRS